jgi:hypothetical protein
LHPRSVKKNGSRQMRHRKWFWFRHVETEPNLFDAATRLSSKSRSSGEKKVRTERTIISYNLPELWLRQIYEIV